MSSPDDTVSGLRWRELLTRTGVEWPVAITAWESAASERLAPGPRGYIIGGAGAGGTRDANVDAFRGWRLLPHVLATPPKRDLSVTLLGQTHSTPLLLAPVGVLSIAHEDGDLLVASAARDLDLTVIVSTAASVSMETTMSSAPGLSAWFQLYWVNNRELVASFVTRAEQAGYSALVLTVDTPMLGWREEDLGNAYSPFATGHGIGQFVSDPIFAKLVGFDPQLDPGRVGVEMMRLFVKPGLTWKTSSGCAH